MLDHAFFPASGAAHGLLIVSCSPSGPRVAQLPETRAMAEANALANAVPNSNKQLATDPATLNNILGAHPVKRFIFCGHGDLNLNYGQMTLCFTGADGQLAAVEPTVIADMIGATLQQFNNTLELVFLEWLLYASSGRGLDRDGRQMCRVLEHMCCGRAGSRLLGCFLQSGATDDQPTLADRLSCCIRPRECCGHKHYATGHDRGRPKRQRPDV